jgi:DNA-binding transcriptional LysR family regulator
MHYTIHQLEIFIKVVEKRSITKASEALFMSQPAVSIQLKKFQEQFEVPLFEVISRSTHITEFGYEVAQTAERILAEIAQLSTKTMAYKGLLTGKLRIMSVSTGKYIIPYLLSDFMNQNSGVELQLDVTNKNEVIRALEQNAIDFALVSILPDHLDLNQENLMENKLFLVGKHPPKSTKKQAPEKVFKETPIIYREQGSGTRTTMEAFLRSRGISSRVKLELTSNEAVKHAVLAGLGYSVMPLIGIKREIDQGLLYTIPVQGLPISTTWQLVWLKGKQLSPAAKAYLSHVQENKQQLVDYLEKAIF